MVKPQVVQPQAMVPMQPNPWAYTGAWQPMGMVPAPPKQTNFVSEAKRLKATVQGAHDILEVVQPAKNSFWDTEAGGELVGAMAGAVRDIAGDVIQMMREKPDNGGQLTQQQAQQFLTRWLAQQPREKVMEYWDYVHAQAQQQQAMATAGTAQLQQEVKHLAAVVQQLQTNQVAIAQMLQGGAVQPQQPQPPPQAPARQAPPQAQPQAATQKPPPAASVPVGMVDTREPEPDIVTPLEVPRPTGEAAVGEAAPQVDVDALPADARRLRTYPREILHEAGRLIGLRFDPQAMSKDMAGPVAQRLRELRS